MDRERLREYGNELFRLLIETVEEYAIFATDPHGRIVQWNAGASRITGFGEEEVLGRTLHELFTPEDREAGIPEHEIRTARELGRSADERWHVRKDGSRFWGLGVMVPLRAPDGTLLGFGKLMRDRTDIKELQVALQNRVDALATADERKTVFIATLAHELRNPQGTLMNAVHLLRQSQGNAAQIEWVADLVERQVRRMKRLTDDLVDIVRVGHGKVQLRKRRMDLRGVVTQSIEAVRPLIEERRHKLAVNQPGTPIELEIDPDRIIQILVNLLSNAARYTEPGGQLGITAGIEGGEAVVRVYDNGMGIAPEQLATIFELFAQAHLTLPESQLGLGIGLALAKDLITLHGGTIQARSDGVGKGSEFIVRLPLGISAADQAREVSPES